MKNSCLRFKQSIILKKRGNGENYKIHYICKNGELIDKATLEILLGISTRRQRDLIEEGASGGEVGAWSIGRMLNMAKLLGYKLEEIIEENDLKELIEEADNRIKEIREE